MLTRFVRIQLIIFSIASIIGIVLFQIIVIIERVFFSWSITDSRGL